MVIVKRAKSSSFRRYPLARLSFSLFCRSIKPAMMAMAFCWLVAGASPLHGAELYTAPAAMNSGGLVNVPIMIDQAQGLAGLKLVVTYDKDALKFKEGRKTQISQSLMHVVNDQKPGRLVVVMAGATGVSGRDMTLINLVFTVAKPFRGSGGTRLEVPEVQLMSDQLKEIPCTVRAKTFVVPF